jgi:transcription antitermination factor NusG
MEISDRVRIIRGKFKDETGIVTSIAEGMCYVSLDSNLEEVGVYVSDCEVID